MSGNDSKRAYRMDLLLACALIASGLAVSGLSLARISMPGPQMAQATPPLQSTPGAETKPSAPAEPATTGTRPSGISPEPAHPGVAARACGKDRGPDQGPVKVLGQLPSF